MQIRALILVVFSALSVMTGCGDGPTGRGRYPRFVLFTLGTGEASEIWQMEDDGTRRRRLTSNDVADATPRWDLIGRRIVFARSRPGDGVTLLLRFDIHIMNADGSDVRRVSESPVSDHLPTLSVGSAPRIAFLSMEPGAAGTPTRIFTMAIDGTDRRPVSPVGLIPLSAAEWSLDGTRLLFAARRAESILMELFVMNADGTGLQTIPDPCANDFQLGRWSRGEMRISLTCIEQDEEPLYVMAFDGTNVRRLTPPKTAAVAIRDIGGMWADHGGDLFVVRTETGTPSALYTLRFPDGAARRSALIVGADFWLADWRAPAYVD